jgi:hypothetical protein
LLSSPAQQTLGHIECCAVKKWPQSKSCGAAFGWALDGRIGPFATFMQSRADFNVVRANAGSRANPSCPYSQSYHAHFALVP